MTNQNIWKLNKSELYRQTRRAQTTTLYSKPTLGDFILDVGCSEGFVASHFLRASFIVGLDALKDSLLIAKQKVRQLNVDFIYADATALPLRPASFNKVTMLEVFEHLPKEKHRKLCREVDKVLKEKGLLIISVPYKEQIIYTRCIHCGKLTPLWGHLCSMDEEKITGLLPNHYTLTASCHLPNVGLVSLSGIFQRLPLNLWLVLNNLLGKFRKGYWIILKYKKEKSTHK